MGRRPQPRDSVSVAVAPLLVQVVATLLARLLLSWRDAARVGMAVLFVFTGASHFSALKHDLAAMIPPPFTGSLPLIYLTGVLEIAGGVGLLTRRFRRLAGWCLIALLVALLPANIHAARAGVTLNGQPASALLWRVPLQLWWVAVVWWSTLASHRSQRAK